MKPKMRTLIAAVILLFFVNLCHAQTTSRKLVLRITTEENTPVESATVEVRRATDSSLVKVLLADKSGEVDIELPPSAYLVKTSAVSHEPSTIAVTLIPDAASKIQAVTLKANAAKALQNVTVAAQKPFLQRLTDRIVVNVENSIISAGSTGLEVLERSPGVIIDQDAISLRGKAGVIIMIDGKPSPLSGADLTNYLRSLPSGAIESIHLITNPSARYDAAGNAGIIDIRMRKDQRLGLNGTFTAVYGQGYYPKGSASTTFNYRNKKMNVFGNYNFNKRKDQNWLIQERQFFNNGVRTGSDNKDNIGYADIQGHTARLGADFFPSRKTVIGFVVNSSIAGFDFKGNNRSVVKNAQGVPFYYFNTLNGSSNRSNNHVANINFKHSFAAGRELSVDADYGEYKSDNFSRITTLFYNMGGSSNKPTDILDAYQIGDLRLKSAKADYVQPLGKTAKLEAGWKSSVVSADNDARFYNILPSGSQVDVRRTNRFFYDETNNAGYLNYSRESKKIGLQVGLRGEHTSIRTHQVVKDVRWSSDYFKLFPSAFFTYKLKENQTVGISLSRRIDRPGYGQLNPFLGFIDATAYTIGNPQLLPQLSWSSEVSYTLKNHYISVGYSRTKDPQYPVIGKVLDVIPGFEIPPGTDSNITVQKPMNLLLLDYYNLTVSSPIKITAWWNMMNNLTVFYNRVKANVGGVQLNNGQPTIFARTNNSFTLKGGWSAELNANILTPRRSGYLVSRLRGAVDAGVQKKVLNGAGTLRLNITDIFLTNIPNAHVVFEGRFIEDWHSYRDTRVANISFSYRFGNSKVQGERRRTTASEEERRRAN